MRLYSLETYIDNGQFETYPLLSTYLTSIYSELYANQRALDEITYTGSGHIFNYNYRNVCAPSVISTLSSVPTLRYYSPSSFSST
jgi:hypothetical protein